MNPETYIENALVTESQDFDAIRARLTDRNIRLLHCAMGVATEAGELLDAIKKALFYGREVDTVNFSEEMFDVTWYLAIGIHELRTSFEQGFDTNIAKLKARYGERFSEARAVNRDLDTERRILEGEPLLPNSFEDITDGVAIPMDYRLPSLGGCSLALDLKDGTGIVGSPDPEDILPKEY